MTSKSEPLSHGPCCMCKTTEKVVNLIMIDRPGAVPGHGWGCPVCDLPADGAFAVLCDHCRALYEIHPDLLKTACRGYPSEGRIPIADLPPGTYEHKAELHRRDAA